MNISSLETSKGTVAGWLCGLLFEWLDLWLAGWLCGVVCLGGVKSVCVFLCLRVAVVAAVIGGTFFVCFGAVSFHL